MAVSYKPAGQQDVMPYLVVRRLDRVLAFVTEAFGAEVLETISGPDDAIQYAEVRIGDSVVMMGDPGSDDDLVPALDGEVQGARIIRKSDLQRQTAVWNFTSISTKAMPRRRKRAYEQSSPSSAATPVFCIGRAWMSPRGRMANPPKLGPRPEDWPRAIAS